MMLKQISETELLERANIPILQIEISDLFWLMDDNLLDCGGVVVSFEDKKILIESREIGDDLFEFVYYEYAPTDKEMLPKKITSTDEEKIVFIRIEKEGHPALRFQIGNRPIITACEDGFLMVGLSHWDVNDKWLEYENNILLNG